MEKHRIDLRVWVEFNYAQPDIILVIMVSLCTLEGLYLS